MASESRIIDCLKLDKISDSPKFHHRNYEKLKSRINSRLKNFSRGENPEWHLPGRCAYTLTICNKNDITQLYACELYLVRRILKIARKD